MAALVEGSAQLIQESSRFMARLRRRQHGSSEAIARKTLEIMRLLIATTSAKDISSLIASIKQAGVVLSSAQPHELTIGNMVRRVLSLVREETSANEFEADDDDEGGILSPGNTIGSAEGGGPSLMRMLDVVKAGDTAELKAWFDGGGRVDARRAAAGCERGLRSADTPRKAARRSSSRRMRRGQSRRPRTHTSSRVCQALVDWLIG